MNPADLEESIASVLPGAYIIDAYQVVEGSNWYITIGVPPQPTESIQSDAGTP